MSRRKIIGVIALVFVALLFLQATSDENPNLNLSVVIGFAGNTRSSDVPAAVLRLENRGITTVRFNAYCTLYWTNRFGMATNSFFRHNQGYVTLDPGESALVEIPHPHESKVWETSFTYQIRPSAMARAINQLKFYLPGTWVPDNSFIGRFGPMITNPSPVTESRPLKQ